MWGVTRRESDDSMGEMSVNWMGCASEKEKYLCIKGKGQSFRSQSMKQKECGSCLQIARTKECTNLTILSLRTLQD